MTPLDHHLVRHCWHLVAHRGELARDRDFLRLDWPLGDLVLINDKGTVLAFDNVCPHRGARFFLDHEGNAPALCAYHGWSFRGGRLRIPRPESYKPCDLARARLNTFHTAWCGDFLFAAMEPELALEDQLDGLAPLLAGISADIDRRWDVQRYTYQSPWRVAVENALEPDHVHMVHAETLGQLSLRPGRNSYHGRNSVLRAALGEDRTVRRLSRLRALFDVRAATPEYTAIHLFPFGFVSTTFGYSYAVQSFLPARDGTTHFTTRLYATRPSAAVLPGTLDSFFDSAAAMNREVFAEDHAICRRVDPGFPMDETGILSETEEKVRHFRASLAGIAATAPDAAARTPCQR